MRDYEIVNSLIARLVDLHEKSDADATPLYNGLKDMSKQINDEDDIRKNYSEYLNSIEMITARISAPTEIYDASGNSSEDIRNFYMSIFNMLRENMLAQPKAILTEFCKNHEKPVSSEKKLINSLTQLSAGHEMRAISWKQVIEGESLNAIERTADVIPALEVPRVLEFSLEEAKSWVHSVSNFGFDCNSALDLIYAFAFTLNDVGVPLSDEEFFGLISYYNSLETKLEKADLKKKVHDPEAENNTMININSITNDFKNVAKNHGKKQAISEMEKFLFRNYPYLDIPSQRCLALFDVLTACIRGLGYKSFDAAKFADGYVRVAPLTLIDAEKINSAVQSKNSFLDEGPNLRPEDIGFKFDSDFNMDLISKAKAQESISRYYTVGRNNADLEDVDITRILAGLKKPTKAEVLALTFRCSIYNWFLYAKTDNDPNLIKSHVIEYASLASSCLEASLLPEFVWSHPLEASYLLSVIAFHDGLVLFNGCDVARADLGGRHATDRQDDEVKLFDSKTYKPSYSYQELRGMLCDQTVDSLYNSLKNDFIAKNEEVLEWDYCFGTVTEVLSDDFLKVAAADVCSTVKYNTERIIEKKKLIARAEAVESAIFKHVRWSILQAFIDRLKSEVFSAMLFNTKVYCKDDVKITFTKKKAVDIETLAGMTYFRLKESSRLPKLLPDDICTGLISAAKERFASSKKTINLDFWLSREITTTVGRRKVTVISKEQIDKSAAAVAANVEEKEFVLAACAEEWTAISEILKSRGIEQPKIAALEMQQIAALCVLTRHIEQLYDYTDAQHWRIRGTLALETTTSAVKYINSRRIIIGCE